MQYRDSAAPPQALTQPDVMGTLTTAIGGATIIIGVGTLLFRRYLSRNWIQVSPKITKNLKGNEAIIVTGGYCGLGFEAAKDLASRVGNGKIILACRSFDKGESAASIIRRSSGNTNVECMILDLASFESIRQFAVDLTRRHEDSSEQLDIHALICNAGVWKPMEHNQKTEEGYEVHFGVNHLGHFRLIQSILPIMSKEDGRIVFVASSLLRSGKIDMQKRDFVHEGRSVDIDEQEKRKSFAPTAYCDSKLMNALTCRQLAVELHHQKRTNNITSYAVCPGFCQSNLGRSVQVPIYIKGIMRLFQRTSAQGAQNIVHVTMEEKEKLVSGAMYQDGKIEDGITSFLDGVGEDVQKQLWDLSKELAEEK
ncbi:hypothetical protein ACHAXM_002831 [Skeletonema potamos]